MASIVLTRTERQAATYAIKRLRQEQESAYHEDFDFTGGDYIGRQADALESLLARAGATEGSSDASN